MDTAQILHHPPISYEQEMKFGTQITRSGTRFRLWAPGSKEIGLHILDGDRILPMTALARGWHECEVEGVGAGTRYLFRLPDGREVPDPASRFQPEDVDGPSEVIDPRNFEWRDRGWRGRPWEEAIIYEVHIGCFTPEGTFRAAIDKLDHLAETGVTAVELMPIADFKGRWNWGYDGALLFAPDSSYGRPEDLKALVDAAHQRGLMMFLDVVYNHFGPSGNYMSIYAPAETDGHKTPWGPAVNFDDEGSAMIRDFVCANARYWLNEFRFDGLRLDATHEIQDEGPRHMLIELAEQLRGATDGRRVHLVSENSSNQVGWLKRGLDGTPWLYTGQWSDDIHHALHTRLTGESFWYYADYVGDPVLLPKALAEGIAWQGEYMAHAGHTKGESSQNLPPTAFVSFLQNHDQIGNRPRGDRLSKTVSPHLWRLATVIIMLAPEIPMLFMGDEWAAEQPFLFFSDIQDLADEVREERAGHLADAPGYAGSPDPMSEEAFKTSKLDWTAIEGSQHQGPLTFYRELLQVRRNAIVPHLPEMPSHPGSYETLGEDAFGVSWVLAGDRRLSMAVNLGHLSAKMRGPEGRILWLEGEASDDEIGPQSVVVRLSE